MFELKKHLKFIRDDRSFAYKTAKYGSISSDAVSLWLYIFQDFNILYLFFWKNNTIWWDLVLCIYLFVLILYMFVAELWLSFWSEVHYNSLYELQGL